MVLSLFEIRQLSESRLEDPLYPERVLTTSRAALKETIVRLAHMGAGDRLAWLTLNCTTMPLLGALHYRVRLALIEAAKRSVRKGGA